jgi:SPP1 gp7 family putative phage head morphogenesis protein
MAYKLAKVIVFPKRQAIKYEKYILKQLKGTIALLTYNLKPFFAANKLDSEYRVDDYVDDLQKTLNDVAEYIRIKDDEVIKTLWYFSSSLIQFTQKQLHNSFKDILTVKVAAPSLSLNVFNSPLLDKNIDLMLKSWVSTNTSLIKSIQTDLLEQVGVIIESSYRSALSMPELTKQLQAKFNISRNRATLIARDQTAKLHSDYIKHEHKQLDITEYVWLTSGDERVRTSHKVLNGKLCQWANELTYRDTITEKVRAKSSIGGVPLQVGQDFQCRCSLRAIVNL